MNDNHENVIDMAAIRVRLADRAHEVWRRAESESERLLHTWFAATSADEAPAYLAYRAALDREEAAARALAPYRSSTTESVAP
jgi:hypothetical protein